jgi:hypothetical protein
MNFDASQQLHEYLGPNEKILWAGQPRKGIVFRTADIFIIPFSLLWCGFAVFWLVTVIMSGAPLLFALFGVPFVIVGLIMVFGRFIMDARQRENTYYGLTNERILIKTGVKRKSLNSFQLKTLSNLEYIQKGDASGTIYVGPKNSMAAYSSGMGWWPGVKNSSSLEMIDDVRTVYAKITEQQHAASGR